jgi:hypothetical protein
MNPCPECGAVETACEARFHECLALEFQNPGYKAVHHLTVIAYTLQHSSQLTREGWLHQRELLRQFIVENKHPGLLRQQSQDLDSGKRSFKIKSKDGKSVISKTAWTKTILDIRMENAKEYREDVKAWAKSVLDESKKFSEDAESSEN